MSDENPPPEVNFDPWIDDEGDIDGEEIQEDLTSFATIAGVFQRQQTNKHLSEQRAARIQEQQRVAALPDCPYCAGKIPKVGVKVCQHCCREISWFRDICCIPGDEDKTRKQYELKQRRIKEAAKREEKSRLAAIENRKNSEANKAVSTIGKFVLFSLLLIPAALSFVFLLFFWSHLPEVGSGDETTVFETICFFVGLFCFFCFFLCAVVGMVGIMSAIRCYLNLDRGRISDSTWEMEKQRFAKRCSFWLKPFAFAYDKCRKSVDDQPMKTWDRVGIKFSEFIFGENNS